MNSRSHFSAVIVVAAALSPAFAGERTATLHVDLKVQGQEQWQSPGGGDSAKVQYVQHVTFSTVVRSDGELVDFNSKDAGYAGQQMAKATQTSLAVTRARNLKPMTQAEFQSRVQAAQAACKTDMQCLMGLTEKISEWNLQMTAGLSQAAPTEQGSGSFLNYFGFENCGAQIHIDLQSTTEGHYADVQGSVPFSVKSVANYDAGRAERKRSAPGRISSSMRGRRSFSAMAGW